MNTVRKITKKEMRRNDPSLASTPDEIMKWEIAKELGLYNKVLDNGWRSLTAKESGRIGGILASRKKNSSTVKPSD
ncbi:MAG: small, acid-soluble spore protein, alpha/beta type [Lachnospiraceae bacterium]|nr:small, acid-soluble spore protein, alpha/beta type [Lachnospiraceae bacterium]